MGSYLLHWSSGSYAMKSHALLSLSSFPFPHFVSLRSSCSASLLLPYIQVTSSVTHTSLPFNLISFSIILWPLLYALHLPAVHPSGRPLPVCADVCHVSSPGVCLPEGPASLHAALVPLSGQAGVRPCRGVHRECKHRMHCIHSSPLLLSCPTVELHCVGGSPTPS